MKNKTLTSDAVDITTKKRFSLKGFPSFRMILFVFLIFIFVNSDLYIDLVLNDLDGGTVVGVPTHYGTMVQAVTATILYIIADFTTS
jgi:hypothetical protein|uniref:Uncharacterized protein n=1 Tax=viral metagenome TaxID=1070528 RepID=A0A6C0IU66_9ZZZZ